MGKMRFNSEFTRVSAIFVLMSLLWRESGCLMEFENPRSGSRGSTGVRIESERGSALVLPLTRSKKNDIVDRRFERRGRKLEESARMTLHDDLLTKGYYTSRVFIGTPPNEFALIVDTGSTVTYVPCSSCTHCGHHQDPRFKPENSSSYQKIGCRSSDCITGLCDSNSHQCKYERMYAEMSTSKGVLGKDLLDFGPASRLQSQLLSFGCETAESGDLYLQVADGIMGLGRGPLSIVDQLVGNGAIEDSFSLCYGGMDEGGGSMVLGAIPAPSGMVFAKSDPRRSNYYNLELTEIQVQGASLKLDSNVFNGKFGTILDSGTTYAYLPDRAFEAFTDAVVAQLGSLQAVDGPDPNYPDICYAGAGTDTKELGKHFPLVDFVFAENQKVSLAPENYLFKHTKVPGAYCLGFFKNQDATTLLGGIIVRNMLVTYDRYNHQIGFLKTNCTELWSILPAEAPLTAPAVSPSVPPANEESPPVEPPSALPSPSVNAPPPLSTESPAPVSQAEIFFDRIQLIIVLDTNKTIICEQMGVFLSSIASELNVSESQINSEDVTVKEEAGQAVVQLVVYAESSQHFSSSSAQTLASRFGNHTVQLPAVFGTYTLKSWKGLPPSRRGWFQSKKIKVAAIVAGVVGLVAMLALVPSLAYWYISKYKEKNQVNYKNLNAAENSEEESLIGDQQL
ncbi:aspartic proteinase nepenthesin-1 isoform X2 [Physcomitrium patens]|uniref:Peptidase A1 domain-containing protein n=1 Tax=Physcomitrium patens TaxID=3218 RepID=A0A2K1KD10_PHYPA|nr:aspartic proteinase nepenthesin-1-like isoform X2 [Physcomitrium patens]PNR51666.1 hypothetical protein PHYPA_010854 [Physcomitrium patens]|eukprot:XP_024381443.1 aspartic proteinase nepenthesin-1-like isoform X2 [Physcomitrella patens]